MLWMRELGMAVELRRGRLRYALIVLTIAAISNTAQYLYDGPSFGGMSGVVFGLFGYIWMRSRYDPLSGLYMPPNMVFFVMAYFFLCLMNVFGSIANMAHGAGLATGAVLGYAPIAWRDMIRK
jgi:GlpG protein